MSNLFLEKTVSDRSQFHNPLLNSDEKRKRKASTWILGDYPEDEEKVSRATKKLKSERRVLDDEEESCVTSTCSRVSVQHKSDEHNLNLRAAMMRCRFAETIVRAQQKQGLGKSVDVERYKFDAKEEVRKAVQKQREAARLLWVVDEELVGFIDIPSGPFLCVKYMISETRSNEASLKTYLYMWRRGALDCCLCI
ncbi:uncharacterized protein LOC141647724 [Silene latifolia]|uniref:uncharacterized protein LOC141647724 n=1 Tax=Silene latifolia TaxID=37657 RepID=UPI003D78916A